jgi:hypothetical protein
VIGKADDIERQSEAVGGGGRESVKVFIVGVDELDENRKREGEAVEAMEKLGAEGRVDIELITPDFSRFFPLYILIPPHFVKKKVAFLCEE